MIDKMARAELPTLGPTDAARRCQKPKAILLATGLPNPPAQEQVLPIGVVRIGQLVLAVSRPRSTRRWPEDESRAGMGEEFGLDPRYVVIAGYANDYANYVTTREEYETQQYEGGSTLFGPWTEASYRQEFVRLARTMKSGHAAESKAEPVDMRTRNITSVPLDGPDEQPPPEAKPGDAVSRCQETVRAGDLVSVYFWTGSPVNEYRRTRSLPGGRATRSRRRCVASSARGF